MSQKLFYNFKVNFTSESVPKTYKPITIFILDSLPHLSSRVMTYKASRSQGSWSHSSYALTSDLTEAEE